jgi:hypothetical protein
VSVKQLVWSEPAPPSDACPYNNVRADTAFGTYLIEWKSWKDYPGYCVHDVRDGFLLSLDTLEAAKAFAQSHFEFAVRECLE